MQDILNRNTLDNIPRNVGAEGESQPIIVPELKVKTPVGTTFKGVEPEIVKIPKADNISVPKSEWEAMKETVRLLEEGGTRKIPKVKDRVSKITLWEDKIVTKIIKTWTERKFGKINPREEDRLYALIETEDKAQYTLDYLDFLNEADRMICAVKKIEKKDVSINHGQFQSENLNPLNPLGENKDKNFRSDEAEDIEEKTDDDYTLEILTGERKGQQITLNHLALNM